MPAEPGIDDDRVLVDRARAGDAQAFGTIVRRYERRAIGIARTLGGSHADAEDVAQEAFVRAYRALRQFRGQSTFRTWLFQIVANTARTHRARRRSRLEITGEPDDQVTAAVERASSGDRIEDAVIARDEVRRALASVPAELREAVVLRDIEGLDYREIADLLDVPIGTVESRIFRGRARLRAALRPDGSEGRTR
jgi:RNA polymerase sigma-70 factor, ECF subfamily